MPLDSFRLQGSAQDRAIDFRIAQQQGESESAESMDTTGDQHITGTGMSAMEATGTQTA